MGVRAHNRLAFGSAIQKLRLHFDIRKNNGRHILAPLGQPRVQLRGEDVCPQCSSDGEPDGRTDGAKHAPDRDHDSNFLVRDGGHNGELATDGEEGSTDTDKDLRHYYEAPVGVWGAEGDEERGAEEHERNARVRGVFDVAGVADDARREEVLVYCEMMFGMQEVAYRPMKGLMMAELRVKELRMWPALVIERRYMTMR